MIIRNSLRNIFSRILIIILISICTFETSAFFNNRKKIYLPTRAQCVAIGDLNNDGIQDIVVGRFPESGSLGYLSILLGRGNGDFQREKKVTFGPGSPYINDIKIDDFNGDNILDIAIAHNNSASLYSLQNDYLMTVLRGTGNGTFHSQQPYFFFSPISDTLTAFGLTTGDFDGDGKADIYLATGHGGTKGSVFPIRNIGKGAFQITDPIMSGITYFGIAAADFNNDSKIDIVAPSSFGAQLMYGDGNLRFSFFQELDYQRLYFAVATGDFNEDGRVDFAVTEGIRKEIRVYLNTVNGWSRPRSYPIKVNLEEFSLVSADFNNDGNLDLAFPLSRAGRIKFMYGNGHGSFFPAGYVESGAFTKGLAAADLNGDGRTDLVAANSEDSPAEQLNIFINSPDTSIK